MAAEDGIIFPKVVRLLHKHGVCIRKVVAADRAGAVVVEPFADAAAAESMLAGQAERLAAALEGLQAYLALLAALVATAGSPGCVLHRKGNSDSF